MSGDMPEDDRCTPMIDADRAPSTSPGLEGFFYHLVVSLQSNFFTASGETYLGRQQGFLYHLIRTEESEDQAWLSYKGSWGITSIMDPEEIYAPVNQVEIEMAENSDEYIFTFRNNMLNFACYEMKEKTGEWQPMDVDRLAIRKEWTRSGEEIMIRAVSLHGKRSGSATILFE